MRNSGVEKLADFRVRGFEAALREIQAGHKHGHWIWYIFPQLLGLGTSVNSDTFGIRDRNEAAAFLRDSDRRLRYSRGHHWTVYKAKDTRLNRTVAIKVLTGVPSLGEELRRRFEREAQAIAALNHPHIRRTSVLNGTSRVSRGGGRDEPRQPAALPPLN